LHPLTFEALLKPIVAYLRVSTSRRGVPALGIEAQREALARFASGEGFELVAEFVEVETGKGSDALDRRSRGHPGRDRNYFRHGGDWSFASGAGNPHILC
jgi:hypothetical protein